MQAVLEELRSVERRLERLLASGWRSAAGEAADLAAEADTLAGLGLPELAALLRRVAGSQSEGEALPAISLALAACQMLRARLPADAPPPGRWEPLASPRRKEPAPDRLLPVSRLALTGGEEVWACIRLRGDSPDDLVLLSTPPPPPPPAPSVGGLVARLFGKAEPAGPTVPWLTRTLAGPLRWQARLPLGASGEVRLCTLPESKWEEPPAAEEPVGKLAAALARGGWSDRELLLRSGSRLLMIRTPDDLGAYAWPDPAAQAALQAALPGRSWLLVWEQESVATPLALLEPGGLLGKPHLVHLAPGAPEPLA